MNNFFEDLKRYFRETPRAEISEKMAKYDVEENDVGPTVEDFLLHCQYHLRSNSLAQCPATDFAYNDSSLKFSGFFFTPIYM